ncbi:replicative DNA helicase [Candidatus Dojkabacteria bacterium]|nr:replicative DNA helicase [Candidatus Dojkabacteria bacterium]
MDRVIPKNPEVESSLIGAFLLDKNTLLAAAEFLLPDHFYDDRNKAIYSSLLELLDEGKPIDLMTLGDKLRKKKKLKYIGGVEYLSELASAVPTAAHAEEYAKIVQDLSVRRGLISVSSKIGELAFDESKELSEVLDQSEQAVFAVSQQRITDRFRHIKDLLKDAYERAELLDQGKSAPGIKSGFSRIDNLLGGFQPSDLIILAARPSVGKSSLALDMAKYAAVHEKKTVAFFSLEMSEIQIMDRLVGMQSGVNIWELRTGKLTDEMFQKLGEAYGVLADSNIYIDDKPGQSVMELRAKARRLKSEVGIDIIFLDYLQLAKSRGLENRVQEISEVSMGLKNLARELKVPVVALSQLSRGVESRTDRTPQLSDLRDSGSIEQDADVVMFIHREEQYNQETERKGVADIIIAKHRNGPVGRVELAFVKELASFRNLQK